MNRSRAVRPVVAAVRSRPPAWYTVAWVLALPLAALYLLWRSLRQSEYRRHWAERFLGHAPPPSGTGGLRIWIHAVSVGETRAAQPLLALLAHSHPQADFVLTHMTPTGRAAGADLVRAYPGRVTQRYLPYDLPFAVARFLDEVRPAAGVLMETEVWPQLLHAADRRRIPIVLANARLSQRSLDKALRHRDLMRRAAVALAAVGAQSDADRARIAQLFDGPVQVTGNGKFDMTPDAGQLDQGRRLRAHLRTVLGERPLWLFASTRDGEERLILEALRRRAAADVSASAPTEAPAGAPAPLLLFVPRHPQRFDEVAALLAEQGATVLRRAAWERAAPGSTGGPPLLLGDSMGEMALYYAMADVALIGGSLLPLGGQNLIEACACGCPVVLGPHMFNFAVAAADAVAAGAARRARDADDALRALAAICAAPSTRDAMVAAALAFAGAHRGATARTAALIEQALRAVAA